jgi:HEAT repeat protein
LENVSSVENLILVLVDIDATIRACVADALGELGDVCAVEPLIHALADSDDFVRARAAKALGKLGDMRAVDPLIHSLADSEVNVQYSSVDALGMLGDPRAVEPLMSALFDPDMGSHAVFALSKLGKPALEKLVPVLYHPNWEIREGVVYALGLLGDNQAVNFIIPVLADPNADVRFSAIKALGKLGDIRSIEPLILLLDDIEQDSFGRCICNVAARSLESIGTPEALAAVADWRARGGDTIGIEIEKAYRSKIFPLKSI